MGLILAVNYRHGVTSRAAAVMLRISVSREVAAAVVAGTKVHKELLAVFEELEGADVVMVMALAVVSGFCGYRNEIFRCGNIPFSRRENMRTEGSIRHIRINLGAFGKYS